MIDETIKYIRKELLRSLGLDETEVIAGDIHELKESSNARGVYISLVNIEEEHTLRNTPHHIRQNNSLRYKEPPVFLNLFLLFAFNFQDYNTGLLHLSKTIEFFQEKRVFSSQNENAANRFPSKLDKLIFDLYNLNYEQLNHLWGVLGGGYFPSVLYKVRLVKIQSDKTVAGPEIKTIQVDTVEK